MALRTRRGILVLGLLGSLVGCGEGSASDTGQVATSAGGSAGASGQGGSSAGGQAGAGQGGAGASGGAGSSGTSGQGGDPGQGGASGAGQAGSAAGGQGGSTAGGQSGSSGSGGAGQGGGGSGGAGGAGASGASGAGSGGAPLVPCKTLVKAGEPVTLDPGSASDSLQFPALAEVDDKAAALGLARVPVGIPGQAVYPVSTARIEPWGAWPAAVEPPTQLTFGGGSAFTLAGGGGNLWVLLAVGAELNQTGVDLYQLEAPEGQPTISFLLNASASRPSFLARAGAGLLAGVEVGPTNRLHRVNNGQADPLSHDLGCSTGQRWSGATALSGGASLVMSTSGAPPGACGASGEPLGPPKRILVYRGEQNPPALATSLAFDTTVSFAGLVGRSDGAWLVYQLGDGVTSGPLVAQRLDASGKPAGDPQELLSSGVIFSAPALARLGDRLAVVWDDQLGQVPKLIVRVFGDDGASLPLVLDQFSMSRTALGAPTADKLLIGWEAPGKDSSHSIKLQRIDCAPEAQ